MVKIYLVGMMGAGKSHWAAKLARRLGVDHFDLDEVIEREAGSSITEIFASSGESAFRKLESDTLRRLSKHPNFVMATGGGAPCQPGNMAFMNENGITIWLDEPVGVLTGRLKQGKAQRPLLANLSNQELSSYITDKLTQRQPYYSQARYRFSGQQLSKVSLEQLLSSGN